MRCWKCNLEIKRDTFLQTNDFGQLVSVCRNCAEEFEREGLK